MAQFLRIDRGERNDKIEVKLQGGDGGWERNRTQ